MSVAVQEVRAMGAPDLQHDPICGFCVIRLEIKPRLRRERDGGWRCPVCRAVTYHPGDSEATAKDLAVMFVEGAAATRERQEQAENEWLSKPRVFMSGPIELKGNRAGGRRRKRTYKLEPPPPYTLA